ncbi:MAG: ATP-binding protein [Saprospiraceae bacterium]
MVSCSWTNYPEFQRSVLEVMRQPMEEQVNISRAKISVDYPASFMLIASMNPCPCGFYNHPDELLFAGLVWLKDTSINLRSLLGSNRLAC